MIARMGAGDSGLFALKGALRAAIVLPIAFALGLYALDSKQAGLFASFGTMAMLVFVDFGGSRRARLGAYSALVAAGLPLVALGTLCSRTPALATVAMALVAFAILFAGVLDGYVAAAHSAALLAFVLPVMVPAPPSALPDRLAGWAIAGVLSVTAEMLLWPMRPRGAIRTQAAHTARALAAAVQARADDSVAAAAAYETAHAAIRSLRARFVSLPHRPSGTASRTAALAHLVEDLGWLAPIVARAPARDDPEPAFSVERAEIEAAVPQALRSVAARLELGEDHGLGDDQAGALGALERVRVAHDALGDSLIACFGGPIHRGDEALASVELDEAYRLRELSFGTLQSGRDALLCCGVRVEDDPLGTLRARIGATGRLARAHATMRSVWLRNSVRGAAGLSVAVLIGQLSDLQHAFWIVLGTMSVLRSNALATGTQAVSALLGTVGGIVLGGLLVVAVGDNSVALWAILPFAVALAAYAPTAISFAAGQAAFSLLVLILFNLIDPTGWKVGLVRVEDVLLGASVSLLAGALIWPRGATAVLRRDVGDAYARAAAYLRSTVDALLGADEQVPPRAARAADVSADLLDETVRDYLAQRSSTRTSLGDLAVLVAGAARARLVAGLLVHAQAFARLSAVTGGARVRQARDALAAECSAVCDWYASLGHAIAASRTPPAPQRSGPTDLSALPARVVLERDGEGPGTPPGVALAWAHHHLAMLTELEADLALAGGRVCRPPATEDVAAKDAREPATATPR
jgi:uncharacterized membrane protein YccC